MPTGDTIIPDKQTAATYDEQAQVSNWFGSQIIFGLTYEFIKPGD